MKQTSNPKQWLCSLLSYFLSIKSIDDNIESLRIALCSQNDFYPSQLFKCLDSNNKDFVLVKDFSKFLNEMKIPFEEKYLRKFIHNFDKDNDFYLNFQEFLGLILPKKNIDLKNKVLINKNNLYTSDRISKTTKNIFGKLLCEELELVKNCIKTAQFCRGSKGFTFYESFIEIAGNERYITENHLYKFLQKNNIDINSNDIHQLMFRVDADDDGKISFNEFEEIFFPMKERELTYKNYYSKENHNSSIISSINGEPSLKKMPNQISKKSNINFTFGQNNIDINTKQNIAEKNTDVKSKYNNSSQKLKGKKNIYNYEKNNNVNKDKDVNQKYGKKYIDSKTEKIIESFNNMPHPNKESNNSKQLNVYTNKIIDNISNSFLSFSYNKIPIYKNNKYNFISQSSNLKHNNFTYKSPKIKLTKSPLYYDYSTYSDEDGDEYFRQRKLRQSAKSENNRNYRIFIDDNRNHNSKFVKKNTIKPCCGCSIFDTLCPCSVKVKSLENCKCQKNNINNNYNYKTSYTKDIKEERKNNNNSFNNSFNTQFFKSKSQFNFFCGDTNENIIGERKFDEKRLNLYKKN